MAARPKFPAACGGAVILLFWLTNSRQYAESRIGFSNGSGALAESRNPDRRRSVKRRDKMVGPLNRKPGSPDPRPSGPTRRTAVGLILGAPLLGACAGSQVSNPFGPSAARGTRRPAAAAACGRHRAGQGRPDPAAVGRRQCRRRRAIDEERRRDGAGGIPESEHPASDQGRRRHPARRRSRSPSRRSARARKSFWARCSRPRCRRPRN